MSFGKRLFSVIIAILLIPAGIAMLIWPEQGYQVVMVLTEFYLFFNGIKKLWFYFTMARFMNGGLKIFFNGLIELDIGLFALTLHTVPRVFAMLYIVGYLLVFGAIGLLRGNEARMQKSGRYKLQMAFGAVVIIFALICFFNLNSLGLIVIFCAIAIFSYAVSLFVNAFRRTAIVYLQ